MENCLFCRIVDGQTPTEFVYQDENLVVFQDLHPKAPVHVLVVPKKHLASVSEAGEEDGELLGKMLLTAKVVAQELGILESGYRLIINNGPDSGQEINHLHLHLLGGQRLGSA